MCNVKNLLVINFKNIALESVGLIFIGFGVEKLYIASQSEKYLAISSGDFDKFEVLASENIGWFFMQPYLWRFGGIAAGFIIIGLIKLWRKNSKELINSLLAFLIVFSLIPIGFFSSSFCNSATNFVGDFLTEKLTLKFVINGLMWSVLGIVIIWFTPKKHYTPHGV